MGKMGKLLFLEQKLATCWNPEIEIQNSKKRGKKRFPMEQITDYLNQFLKKRQHIDMGALQDWRLDRHKHL